MLSIYVHALTQTGPLKSPAHLHLYVIAQRQGFRCRKQDQTAAWNPLIPIYFVRNQIFSPKSYTLLCRLAVIISYSLCLAVRLYIILHSFRMFQHVIEETSSVIQQGRRRVKLDNFPSIQYLNEEARKYQNTPTSPTRYTCLHLTNLKSNVELTAVKDMLYSALH